MIKALTSDCFETLKRCPYAYYLKYVKGIRFADRKGAYQLGRDIHSLAYYKLQGLPIEKIEKNLDEVSKKHWVNLQKYPLLSEKLVCAEWGFDVPIVDEYWINGRIDAVFSIGDEYVIADWKTGQSLPYAPEESYQALIYMWAFYCCQDDLGLKFEPEQLKFIFVSTEKEGVQKEVQCSREMISKIDSLLKEKIKEMEEAESFEKIKNSCGFCPYEGICE